jgi:DNA-3-methyladenine glycosylase
MERLPREFFARTGLELAPLLLNKILVHGECAGRVIEVEAYMGADDPASHAFRGKTKRNAVMFGPAGHLYVYFTYGMHYCCNVVAGDDGVASAVLLRAVQPMDGLELMQARRARARRPVDLTNGPAKICQALAIDRGLDGADLVQKTSPIGIFSDGTPPPEDPGIGPRIGIREGRDLPWRFWNREYEKNLAR